ncbi:MAG: hypothetical protein IJS01_11320 [Lentisphaeria bacterium]|nr:hypothetical protein [Lentisphaeria bacterium]
MKIAWFKKVISPEIGACLAGYGIGDKSVAKLDDLYATGLCADDGENKILIVGFDLLGLDEWYITKLRKECAEILGIESCAVLFSCTHTHTGPESRTMFSAPQELNTKYLDELENGILEEVKNLRDFRECSVYFYSSKCDENRNRRYVTACNRATFTPHRREVVPTATEYADKELGQLCFLDKATGQPLYVVGNYAAHPLAGHSPGLGGRRISADFPGAFRRYVTSETGAECMFISGAAGDLVPREDELGADAIEKMGRNLAKAAIGGLIDCTRNPLRFRMDDAKVGAVSKSVTIPLRKNKIGKLPAYYAGKTAVELEMQAVSIGDVCFVGVPGELCCELGQEIKWHSPFRRTWIAYNSTSYMGYIGHANMLMAGGYEGSSQRITARGGLALLNTAADALFELREKIFPSEADDPYPDNLTPPLVNIPAGR